MSNSALARQRVSKPLVAVIWVLASVTCTTAVALVAATSTAAGAFTAAQAERGKTVYEKSCSNCHQADFYRERLPKYENRTVGELFQAVSTTMPADNVGSLLTSEYVDVISYIFSITGAPAGNTELTADNMDTIKVSPLK